jgi:hypothetical protein
MAGLAKELRLTTTYSQRISGSGWIPSELWTILRYTISSPADQLGGRLLTRLVIM